VNIEYILLLRKMIEENKTGEIRAEKQEDKRVLYIEKGLLMFCETTKEDEKLLKILYSLNFINKTKYNILQKEIKNTPKKNLKTGQRLVREKVISPAQLYSALRYQAKKIAIDISKDSFLKISFSEKENNLSNTNKLNISLIEILLQAYEFTTINEELKQSLSGKIKKLRPLPVFDSLLTAIEKELLENIEEGIESYKFFKQADKIKILLKLYMFGFIFIEKSNKKEITQKNKISDSFLEEIKEYYELSVNKNYSTILNGKGNERKRNYLKLVKKFHPDRLPPTCNKEIKKMVEAIFDAVNKAFSLDEIKETEKEEKVSDEELAAQTFSRASYLFKNEKYNEVIRLIKNVLNYNELNSKTILLLAKAEAKLDSYKKDAEKDFLYLIEKEPWMKEAYYQLLSMYEEEKLTTRAKPIIRKALQYFPNDETLLQFSQKLVKPKKKKLFPF
jgi:curved DNA-binding protein CbpA